jgi:HJR/Mrr/RecB family endonuclease
MSDAANSQILPNSGDEVQVTKGPLSGITATVIEKRNNGRLVLDVQLINRSVSVKVDMEDVSVLRTALQVVREQVRIAVTPITDELIYHIGHEPELLHELSARKFEELIAHLFVKAGYEVQLTPQSHDGGRDILAMFSLPFGSILTVVECKQFAQHRRLGPDVVHRLLWVADRYDNASNAMLATTSTFTRGARDLEQKYQWRLTLKDYKAIAGWLKGYGVWQKSSSGDVWLPSVHVCEE